MIKLSESKKRVKAYQEQTEVDVGKKKSRAEYLATHF